jgi:carbonic anhydrase
MRNSVKLLLCIAAIVALVNGAFIFLTVSGQDKPPHWTYEGEEGPANWGKLDPAYAACSDGKGQSPIDIANPVKASLVNIRFDYQPSALNIFNNGHTIQVNYDAGSSITYNETTYKLLQFHFHHPSEHTINGKQADMEIHFVHSDDKGNLAVVGVMLMIGDRPDKDYGPVFDHLPAEAGTPEPSTDLRVNATDLLPDDRTFYTYMGSLTTPPCSQGVRWLLLTTPVTISKAEADAFAKLYELNARPVQPLNQRDLLQDSSP